MCSTPTPSTQTASSRRGCDISLIDFTTKSGLTIASADIADIVNHLQGASGKTDAWHFRVSSGNNYLITLSDAAGAQKFSIRDSGGVEKFSVDSDGNVTLSGTFAPSSLTLPTSAAPAQTTDGSVSWDSDDDLLTIGTGAATKVIGLSRGAGSDASATQELMYDTTNTALKVWNGSASTTITTPLSAGAQAFVESSGYKGFFALGAPSNAYTPASGDQVGLGCVVEMASNGTVTLGSGTSAAGWVFSTSATSGGYAGVRGPDGNYTSDFTMIWRGVLPTNAAIASILIGFSATGNFQDGNNLYAFRVVGTGNIIGVCDSSGSETTRDSGVTPDGTTECTLRIEVRNNGTIVRFYRNNVQIGADVTTNITTSTSVKVMCGIRNNTTTNVAMTTYDLYGWREV